MTEEASATDDDVAGCTSPARMSDAEMSGSSDSEAEEDPPEPCDSANLCRCVGVCSGRPTMRPCSAGAKVFSSQSTPCSRALASTVRGLAASVTKTHGVSTTGTPWLYARRLRGAKSANGLFLSWCREWISELYGIDSASLHAARTEPHIVKYNHANQTKLKFEGIGTHQDGSFATCIMAVSDPVAYSGGGTYFPHLGTTVNLGMGDVLLFQGQGGPYAAPHRAVPIASGARVLYLAFFTLKPKGKAAQKRRRWRAKRRVQPCEVV